MGEQLVDEVLAELGASLDRHLRKASKHFRPAAELNILLRRLHGHREAAADPVLTEFDLTMLAAGAPVPPEVTDSLGVGPEPWHPEYPRIESDLGATAHDYYRPQAAARAVVPAAYAEAARRKLERDRKSFEEFRAADERDHEQVREQFVTRAVKAAEGEVQLRRMDLEALEEHAAEKLAAFRALEDKSRAVGEYARLQLAAYEKVRGLAETPPEEETELSLRSSAAEETAFNARTAAGQAEAESGEADRDLAEVREQLTAAERKLDMARKAARVPAGPAPLTDTTIRANASYLQADEVWATLDRDVRFRLRYLAEPRGVLTDQEWREQMHALTAANGGGR